MKLTHYYQPSNASCVQSATAMLLSAYGVVKTPDDVLRDVAVRSWPGKDEPAGTPNQDVAAYMCKLGFDVHITSFDTWVTDFSWKGKTTEYIRKRLKEASGKLTAPVIGRQGTELYIRAYLDFIKAGGTLSVEQAPTTVMLTDLLGEGPILTTVNYTTLHGSGKAINAAIVGEEYSRQNDIYGYAPNHNIVITDFADGVFTFYDSWKKPGIHQVEADILLAAISVAQQECDNMIVTIRPKKKS